jgi:hypothetical protein
MIVVSLRPRPTLSGKRTRWRSVGVRAGESSHPLLALLVASLVSGSISRMAPKCTQLCHGWHR